MIIHIPLWKGKWFRFEVQTYKGWASNGRNPDGSFKVYDRNRMILFYFGVTKFPVSESWFSDN